MSEASSAMATSSRTHLHTVPRGRMPINDVIDRLLRSDEPSVRWRARTAVLGEAPDSPAIIALQQEIRRSPRIRSILNAADGLAPYTKWKGPHWALMALAELGYPSGDSGLFALREAVLDQWLAPRYLADRDVVRATKSVMQAAVPRIAGRSRRCGSQHGGALLAVVRLGLDDGRASTLAARLQHWQWDDGGWNCDRRTTTTMSSVNETLLPMRGLAAYAGAVDDHSARSAARAAAEVLLSRRVAWRRSSPDPIWSDTLKLHHPVYWHYDVLAGLVGLAELDLLDDPRCDDALGYLESRRLPDGGWGADARYWRVAADGSNVESMPWGTVSKRASNEWVTCDALAVLTAAGRL